jgi:hypothetical protein
MVGDELQRITSDFQCFVCGAIFSTDQDKRQHLQKELHGEAREETSADEASVAQEQKQLSENHRQTYETTA